MNMFLLLSPVGFTRNPSLLEIFVFLPGGLSKLQFGSRLDLLVR